MKTLIIGCGYLGTALGARLAEGGARVWGVRRSWRGVKASFPSKAQRIEADLLRPESLAGLPEVDFAVLCQAPSRPGDSYEGTYYKGTRHLITRLRETDPRFILVSSTRVYSTNDGSWVDEDTDPRAGGEADDNSRWLLETERWALQNSSCIVFRLGGIYGPGRNRLAARALTKVPEGSDPRHKAGGQASGTKRDPSSAGRRGAYVNRIHVEDAVSGIALLMKKGKVGEIYLGVDDLPSIDSRGSALASGKRCSNAKIKRLGLRLKYPTYKEG
ncbi:MAG: NAD-dependent epimerase/dehydratase family protein, partial [Candidatus Omnitrophica bacterium]|nr:NAD-dependent epimerase/dehydratase family protein [Candidatus Omnitrophota bacterium]